MQQPNLAPFETAFTVAVVDKETDLISFDSLLEDARANAGQQQFRLKAFLDTQVILLTNKAKDSFTIEQHLNVLEDGVIVERHEDKKVMSLVYPGVYEKGKLTAQLSGIRVIKGEVNIIIRCTAVVDMGSGLVTGGVILPG
jgi:hypothetical protein